MFKLMIISVLASIATVQCGTILTPVVGKLVSEKVIEAHGNHVVHPSPSLLSYPNVALVQHPVAGQFVAQPLAKASLIAEKTIEAHGHQVIHDARPLIAVAKPQLAPAFVAREIGAPYYSPYYAAYPQQFVAEKTVSSYGHSIQHA
ncbi:uncharacterized protein LOC105834826 [Monomorium pharaonis]|uniref:uncharacterized protein LOC105834826 n=1 Tax=Monomorium pharaonis TaxID=307658 RepID=UPI00063F9C64|nr:uncharacterized protein LOC105834826 [Monomorium pharaonis]